MNSQASQTKAILLQMSLFVSRYWNILINVLSSEPPSIHGNFIGEKIVWIHSLAHASL